MIDKTFEEMTVLPDGSGFFEMNMPLPANHWLMKAGDNIPPMPLRTGTDNPMRKELEAKLREAAKFAIRASTSNGKITDFDPDAMVQNFLIGALGYFTSDGLKESSPAYPKK